MNAEQQRRLARLALDGLSVGDAFGERFFGPAERVLPRIERGEIPPAPWRWTDDTAMGLSVVEVLERHGRIDADALASAFARRWYADPHRGYGGTAWQILERILCGEDWRTVSSSVFGGAGSMGNGAAMRVAPLGAWFADDPAALVRDAALSAAPTHAHPDAHAGAIAVAAAAAAAVRGEDLFAAALALTPAGPTREGIAAAADLPLDTPPALAASKLGNGAKVICSDTVPFSIWCARRHRDDFAAAMWATVAGLGDRDTTCAIVGGIVAAGGAAPPAAWLAAREPLPE